MHVKYFRTPLGMWWELPEFVDSKVVFINSPISEKNKPEV